MALIPGLGPILGNLLGLQPANSTTTTGFQVLQSTQINLATTTPQSIYTPVSGNTLTIIPIAYVLKDPDGVLITDSNVVRIYMNGVLAAALPEYHTGGTLTGLVYTMSPALPVFFQTGSAPAITAVVGNSGSTGTVTIDVLGYAI